MTREDVGRRVLIVLHGEEVGGASLSVLRAIPYLEELGWRMTVWAPRPSELYNEVKARGLDGHGQPRPIAGYSLRAMRISPGIARRVARAPRYYRALDNLIREIRPTVVHCNSMYTLDEALVARARRVPVVFHVHEMVKQGRKHRLARSLMHRVGHEVVGVSTAGASALSISGSAAALVHECVRPYPSVPARDRRSGAANVGTIGVIARRKGTDLFVDVARRAGEAALDARFHIVGAPTDPLEADWAEAVLADAREGGVSYSTHADVEETLASWDIFVLPSRIDPFPIVVLEAMSSGLPVIGTHVDGIPEQLADGSGILVPADDPTSLFAAVRNLCGDRRLRVSLGQAARSRVNEHFNIERQARNLAAIYGRIGR